jgi:hypothetical protein
MTGLAFQLQQDPWIRMGFGDKLALARQFFFAYFISGGQVVCPSRICFWN